MHLSIRARWTVGMLATSLAVAAIKVPMAYAEIDNGVFSREAFAQYNIAEFAVFFGTAIAWLIWQYSASRQLRDLGVPKMFFTPPVSVLVWFIPIANFALPAVALWDLWKASESTGSQRRWYSPRFPWMLVPWWLAFWVERVLVLPGMGSRDLDDMLVWDAWSNVISVVGAVFAIVLVVALDRRVQARAAAGVAIAPEPVVGPIPAMPHAPALAAEDAVYAFFARADGGVAAGVIDTSGAEKWESNIRAAVGMPDATVYLVREGEWNAPRMSSLAVGPESSIPGIQEYFAEHDLAPMAHADFQREHLGDMRIDMTGLLVVLVKHASRPARSSGAVSTVEVPTVPTVPSAPPQPGAPVGAASEQPAVRKSGIQPWQVVAIVVPVLLLLCLCAGVAGYFAFSSGGGKVFEKKDGGGGTADSATPTSREEDLSGQVVFHGRTGDNNFDIFVMDVPSGSPRQLTTGPDFDVAPSWSPDGSKIAFTRVGKDGGSDVFTMDAQGGNEVRITPEDDTPEFGSAWSPDGRKFLTTVGDFAEGQGSAIEVWVMSSDGSDRKRLTSNKVLDATPSWSPDGKQIAYATGTDGTFDIHIMNADGSGDRTLTDEKANDFDPVWSRDGKRIVFARGPNDAQQLFIIDVDGTDMTPITPGRTPTWSPGGEWIMFARGSDLYAIRPDGSGEAKIGLTGGPESRSYPSWRK